MAHLPFTSDEMVNPLGQVLALVTQNEAYSAATGYIAELSSLLDNVFPVRTPGVTDTRLAFVLFLVLVYFTSLFVCWAWTLRESFRSGVRARSAPITALFVLLSFANVAIAWWYIVQFMVSDRANYTNLDEWVAYSDWFVKAYEHVTATPQQWFWSSQLLLFAIIVTVFVYIENYRVYGKRPAAVLWLGCAAAISLCFPLCLISVINAKPVVRRSRYFVPVNKTVIVAAVVGCVSIVLLPFMGPGTYGPVLAALHGAVMVPTVLAQLFPKDIYGHTRANIPELRKLIEWTKVGGAKRASPTTAEDATSEDVSALEESVTGLTSPRREGDIDLIALEDSTPHPQQEATAPQYRQNWIGILYAILAGFALNVQVNNLVNVVLTHEHKAGSVAALRAGFCSNPSQCSISFDLVNCTVSAVAFILFAGQGRLGLRCLFALGCVVWSLPVVFPMYLAYRESVTDPATLPPLTRPKRWFGLLASPKKKAAA